jgi:hypothetical protein
VKVAQKLLGAPTSGVGSAWAGSGGGGSYRRHIPVSPKPAKIYKNGTKNGWFFALFGLKIAKKAVFCTKLLNKIYSQDNFFEEYIDFKCFVT